MMIPAQIYLLCLGILFSKKFTGAEGSALLQLTANAQIILLYLLYNKQADYTKKDLAIRLGLDPVYVTRGTKELVSRGFIAEKRKGRSVEVGLTIDSKELFNVASSALSSPVGDVIYVRKTEDVIGLPKTSDFALSEISMLNPPEIAVYASLKKTKDSRVQGELENILEELSGSNWFR